MDVQQLALARVCKVTFYPLTRLSHASIPSPLCSHFYQGRSSVQSELDLGVGWQDPSVIQETGLCVWKRCGPGCVGRACSPSSCSGHRPRDPGLALDQDALSPGYPEV